MSVRSRGLATACAAVCFLAACCAAQCLTCGFESGVGRNGTPIGDGIPGLMFSTTTGGNVYYADINTGYYSVTSDNGKTYEDGEYFVSGDGAAYVANLTNRAKVSFTQGLASYFTVGYSSQFSFVLEAYNAQGALLTSATGPANTKSQGGTGLSYLTASSPDTAYVVMHDQGGYWLIDSITTDAPVPEPASLSVIAAGLGAFALRRVRK